MNQLTDCSKRQQGMIEQVKFHNRLVSDVAKEYGISSKSLYLLLRNTDRQEARSQTRQAPAIIAAQIAQLQQQINLLSQQLS